VCEGEKYKGKDVCGSEVVKGMNEGRWQELIKCVKVKSTKKRRYEYVV
jgi:hypothetical protein